MMKIAFILPSLKNTGPIILVKNLIDCLIAKCDIKVFYFDESQSISFPCPTAKISMNVPIDFNTYDIIHSHCFRPNLYVFKWTKKINRAKVISTLHQDTYKSFCYQYHPIVSYIFTIYWCWVQSHFDGIISISEQLKKLYETKIRAPITTIYNGCEFNMDESVDESIVQKILYYKKQYKMLGSYALVTKRKGLGQVIKSLAVLRDYAFTIIGEGPDIENLKSLAIGLGVENRVLFFPYSSNPCNYLFLFDVYVMPSYSEGFGLAMVEAALSKKAIVCSDIPSFHEIFPNKEVSFFELDNIGSLRMAIEQAYKNRNIYGKLAHKRANDCFTASQMAGNHLKYYRNILKK